MAKRPAPTRLGAAERVRCAIYTRKSTEEGLDQAFNSLDAQREACAAYIASQRAEGWTLLPTHYDDGGFSGGTMERPALRQLLADVASGQVDVIVIYKVDRLTRALSDFAKIIDVMDRAGASFVSVTQAFNTTTSMGRLTLNMLLSFAQFEREVTGERIRDKVAASKRKGMFMGGLVPLGYDVKDRKLIINEPEAARVRLIYQRYLVLGSLGDLAAELEEHGIRSKPRVATDGQVTGDRPFSKGALAHLLKNRIYIGEVSHLGQSFPGEHRAIVARETWDQVQACIAGNGHARQMVDRVTAPSLLAGMLRDGEGRTMTPRHAVKSSRRYRYYVTTPSTANGRIAASAWKVPAGEIEQLVADRLRDWLRDAAALAGALHGSVADEALLQLLVAARALALTLSGMPLREQRDLLQAIDAQVQVDRDQVVVSVATDALVERLSGAPIAQLPAQRCIITIAAALTRRGHELRLAYAPTDKDAPAQIDVKLVGLLAKAHAAHRRLESGSTIPSNQKAHLTRLARLTCLAPDITCAILEGRQPVPLTARTLLRVANLPLAWDQQRIELRFG